MQVLAWLERYIIHLLRKSINSPLLEQSAQDQKMKQMFRSGNYNENN